MSLYATLDDVRSELNAEDTVDDKEVLRGIRQVSRRIDGLFRSRVPLFVPTILTRRCPVVGVNVNSVDGTLLFNTPLLSLTGVGINSQTFTVGTTVQAYPVDSVPYFQLQLMGDCFASWYSAYCSGVRGAQFAAITGVWGYHADYANAWLAVDTLQADLNATATTFTVEDIGGDTPLGDTPRISAGHVVRIDDEWMDVIDTSTVTNTVTVRRGVNGSTAATHDEDAAVSVYLVDENIRRATARQAAYQYTRQGAYDTTRISDFSTITFPKDVLDEFNGLLRLFANM
jgi:hypothetical protein